MPDNYVEGDRYLFLGTPLGPDALLLAKFSGSEAISELFRFELKMYAPIGTNVPFDQLLGQGVEFGLKGFGGGPPRHFHGIIAAMKELHRDETFTHYEAAVVPKLWVLTQVVQSRIFQQKTVPDILNAVLSAAGIDVTTELQGTYEKREFVTQYHESDFAFVSRLMEEEGIFYFFKHQDGPKMVVGDVKQSFKDVPGESTLMYDDVEGGNRDEERIVRWSKQQELRSGKYTLWDHNFQLAHKHLAADQPVVDTVQVGTVSHKLKLAGNDTWEIFEYPGEYAKRFDGINSSGGEQSSELNKIFTDNSRTAKIRMHATETPTILIRGGGKCRLMMPGFKFTLAEHFDANGPYVLTAVYHEAAEGDFRAKSIKGRENHYQNSFLAIPSALTYIPPRTTPRPVVAGAQTAIVCGPSGEEIFTDKYGRVKAQFHWDRDGQYNASSSCWMRVGTPWAGKQWGAIHIPRIGQEVIVEFLEGDPDRPIIVGSVYNADTMPPYDLPENKTQSGIKSRSSKGGGPANFNEIRFEDKAGSELITIHAEKNQTVEVEADETHYVGHDQTITIDHDRIETVKNDEKVEIKMNRHSKVGLDRNEKVGMDASLDVGMNYQIKAGMKMAVDSGMEIHLKAGMTFVIEAGVQLSLKAGASFVDIGPAGVSITGPMVMINSGGAAGSGSGSSPKAPEIGQAVADTAKAAAANGPAVLESATKNILKVVSSVATAAVAGVGAAAAASVGMMQQLGQMAQGVQDQVVAEVQGAINKAEEKVAAVIDDVKSGLEKAVDEVKDAANKVADAVDEIKDQVEEKIDAAVDEAKKSAEAAIDDAKQAVDDVADKGKEAADEGVQKVKEAEKELQKAADDVKDKADEAVNKVKDAAEEAKQDINDATSAAVQKAKDAEQMTEQGARQIEKDVKAAADRAETAVASAADSISKVGDQASKAADDVKNAISDLGL